MIVLLALIVGSAVLFILLRNNKVQNYIAREVTSSVSEKLKTKVSVGNVDYHFFNTFKFEDFYIEDQNKNTLLYVNKAYADFDFWKFFKGKFVFNEILLDGFQGNLITDSAGVNNLDFVIQAFKKPQKDKKSSPIEFNLKDIRLTNSAFKLYNLQRSAKNEPNRFDGNRIDIRDINAKISVDYFKGDSLSAMINELSAKEKSGLTIEKLTISVQGYKSGFRFPALSLQLPNSKLELDSVRMDYDSISSLKSILNSVRWNAKIKPSNVVLKDLAAFVPNFSQMNDPVKIKGDLVGRISSFRVRDLEVQYRNSFLMKANVDLNGIPDIDETFIFADVKDFRVNRGEAQDFISKLTKRPFVLPKELGRLGTVKYSGNISGFFSNLVAYGNILTDVGSLKTDILLQMENNMRDLRYNGTVESSSFQLGRLLANNTLGKTAFKINTKGTKLHNRSLQGTITGDIPEIYLNKYNYQNISLDGNYDGTGFEGEVEINDPNLVADFNGVVDLTQKLPILNFDLFVENADINALKLTDSYEGSQLSFRGNTNMVGNSLDNLNGYLLLDSIRFMNKGNELAMNLLLFESEVGEKTRFSITSDLINGHFDGKFKYSTIPQSVTSIVQNYLPSLSGTNVIKKGKIQNGDNFIDIDLTLNDTKLLSEVFELPIVLDGVTTIKGYLDESSDRMQIDTETPYLSLGKRQFKDIKLILDNENQQLNMAANGSLGLSGDVLDLNIKAAAANDSVYTQFAWHNNDSVVNAGELQAYTKIYKENELTSALVNFMPTQVILFDSVWDVRASHIEINPDSTFDVHKFQVQNKNQYVLIDGIVSKDQEDVLEVEMKDIDLGFILGLLPMNSISINGKASGIANVRSVLKQPIFESNLFVKDARLNDSPVGDAYIYSGWSQNDNELLASGTFLEGNDIVALANGAYSLEGDSINFVFDANRLNIAFLQRWLGGIVQNVNGRGTGSVRMFGPVKNIGFEGDVFAENTSLSIDFLNTTYTFSDYIHLTRKSIEMNNIKVFDVEGNSGTLNGLVTHDGSFKGFNYDIKINAKNMIALNTRSTDNDFFYGKAYGTGDVHIYGEEDVTFIDINAQSQPKTKFYVSVGGASVANENDFITFVNPNDSIGTTKITNSRDENTNRINLSMNLDVTPDAEIQLILDPKAGDMISATGNGNLRLLMYGEDDFRMYGGYTIEKGNYIFTLENIIRKQFKIDEGSTIVWVGDPLRAQLDIRAIHTLTASLYDLMSEDILRTTDRTSVPVNAILHLTEDLTSPNIQFNVDLPSSDETLKMQVRNLINTEEMMNRQMVYLLLFGKFYTPEYNRNAGDLAGNTFSNVSSLASSAAFGQVNNYLSQLFSNLSLGVNVRSTGYGGDITSEYETAIMYTPNNRLIVNGNFGYRDDNFARNKIIGDLDVEYILTDNSKWRLKAFNHTVDRYSLRSAPFIQGVGIMYKEDFNSWGELWRRYMNAISTKEKPDSVQSDTISTNGNSLQNDTILTQ